MVGCGSFKKKSYRPLIQDTPGYKTFVDTDSQLGIYPAETDPYYPGKGQSNLDSMWPVQMEQGREKQRALPLPSNHDTNREKSIGPTYYNKPENVPYRTLSVPGEEYGHPTKFDYGFPMRRNETLASVLSPHAGSEDIPSVTGAGMTNRSPFPERHQKHRVGPAKAVSRRWYMRNKAKKKRRSRLQYKIDRKQSWKKKDKRRRRESPKRFQRRGIDPRTPAQHSKEWRKRRKRERELSPSNRKGSHPILAGSWPIAWDTLLKDTVPPEYLDQNFGKGQSRDTGTPREDHYLQEGASLRAPNLTQNPQRGIYTQDPQPPIIGINPFRINNPTDGSGKVIPLSYYTDLVNNTQAIPDGRQDRYLRNNNFVVKHAGFQKMSVTVGDILKRCDRKIKERSKNYTPRLKRIDTKNWIWHWQVGEHTVKIQAFKKNNSVNFDKLNIQVSCSCPFWRWWGPECWGSRENYQSGPLRGTGAYPRVRDPAHWRPVCKHAYAALKKSRDFFVRPKKSPLKKLSTESRRLAGRKAHLHLISAVAYRYLTSTKS